MNSAASGPSAALLRKHFWIDRVAPDVRRDDDEPAQELGMAECGQHRDPTTERIAHEIRRVGADPTPPVIARNHCWSGGIVAQGVAYARLSGPASRFARTCT